MAEIVVPAQSDLETSARMLRKVFEDQPLARTLVLDLAAVRVPTAAGLGELVALDGCVRESGGCLVLRNASENVYEVFRVTHLTDLLDVRLTAPMRA